MSEVSQLGYIGLGSSNVDEWERFGADKLGLQPHPAGRDVDGTLFLRQDENHHRIAIHPSEVDDVLYLGWEVKDEEALASMKDRIGPYLAPQDANSRELESRRVRGMFWYNDINGIRNEVYWGPLLEPDKPFRSPRSIDGFETGDMGMGHVVLVVPNARASMDHYREKLGLRVSDTIEFPFGPGKVKMSFLHCNGRHHSIAFAEGLPSPKKLNHFMIQVNNVDDVLSTWNLCKFPQDVVTLDLGKHTNDRMTSFYAETPSGVWVEYGFGARVVDEASWEVGHYNSASIYGHQPIFLARMAQHQEQREQVEAVAAIAAHS